MPPWSALAVAWLVAFALRAAYVVVQTRFSLLDAQFVASDSNLYLALARSLAAGNGLSIDGAPTAFVGPGYPIFLAPLLLLGADAPAIGFLQSVLGATTAVLVGLMAFELSSGRNPVCRRRAAIVSAAGAAIYPHLIFWTGYVLTETLFVFLVAGAFLTTLAAVRTGNAATAAAAGALSAAAALTRPPYLVVALVFLLWWLVWLLVRERATRRAVVPLAFALALALPLAAWAGRNVAVFGAPVVTSTESGFVLYQGNSPGATGGSGGYVDERDYERLAVPAGLNEAQRDLVYLAAALEHIRTDPGAVIGRWPAKLWNMWRPTYEGASLRNGAVSLASYLPVLVLGVMGAAALLRRGASAPTALPALFLLVWIALHVLVTGMIRFRLAPEVVLLAAVPFAVLWVGRRRG